ncbi:hypothetical protein GLOIN_2v1777652 [Rhizophagus clarus]|nr:hypothetical protein GLOIN_2v1777652 [Rhizophagus clarus]
MDILRSVIISHLPEEVLNRDTENLYYEKPSFNYIRFCKYMDFGQIMKIITSTHNSFREEIIKLFVNKDMKYTHLNLGNMIRSFEYQLSLIPEIENCFSEIEFLSCYTRINDSVLTRLTGLCNSIRELELFIEVGDNNNKFIKLIENQKKLVNVHFINVRKERNDEPFCRSLENTLVAKHVNTVHSLTINKQPITKFLSSFVNLISLEINSDDVFKTWRCIENLKLPFLQFLKTSRVSANPLISLIKNTGRHLVLIKIDDILYDEYHNRRIIEAIYQNCPKLKYLKLEFKNRNVPELENLLANCKYLNGLFITMMDRFSNSENFFDILSKSSPESLFKFKFSFWNTKISLETVKLFLDNWKGRYPILLQSHNMKEHSDLIEEYKTKGVIKKYDHQLRGDYFEWF